MSTVPTTVERHVSLHRFPGGNLVDKASTQMGARGRPLAEPPAGSGLAPVMGMPGPPLIGTTLLFLRHGPGFTESFREKYGSVCWSSSFGRKSVWVLDPEGAREVLTARSKDYSQSGWAFFIGAFFNRGLMLLDGQEHLLHRRIMQEAFTRPRLESYTNTFAGRIDHEVRAWPTDTPFLLNPAIRNLSLGVATTVFMGADPQDSARLTGAFVDTVRACTSLVRMRVPGLPFLSWNKGLAGRKVLEDYFAAKIPQKRADEGNDLFSALCHARTEEGETFTDTDVVNHMIFLMMAAHDTTTITSTAVAYYLAKHPELQERARAESEALRGQPITLDLLDKLTVIDRVFAEGMRLVAPVPALVRETVTDTEVQGRYVPKGTMVSVIPDAVHRAPPYWSDPESFDTDRFLAPREEQKSHRFAHLPFGGGAHKCIGMAFGSAEVKTIIHTLLLNYRIEIPRDYVLDWDHTSLVVPTDGFPVTLHALKENS